MQNWWQYLRENQAQLSGDTYIALEWLWIGLKTFFFWLGKIYKNVFHDYFFFSCQCWVFLGISHSCGTNLLELGICFLHHLKYMSITRWKGEEMLVVFEMAYALGQQGVWRYP